MHGEVLGSLGWNVSIDLAIHPSVRQRGGVVLADVCNMPFRAGQFDVIYSNHVMEHVEDPEQALAEILRVGRGQCLYLIALPTPLWLLLSIPGQYLYKARRALSRAHCPEARHGAELTEGPSRYGGRLWQCLSDTIRSLMPLGHGIERSFLRSFLQFRSSRWRSLFERHGFEAIRVIPLLLYGPSEWSIVPTVAARGAILSSSTLFVLRSRTS